VSLEPGDAAYVLVSSDGVDRRLVLEFTPVDADGQYRFYDIDLSAYQMTAGFTVYFYSGLDPGGDQWHLDDVELVAAGP